MKKAGGIIALIAGIFGVLAALVTVGAGACGSAMEAEGSGTIAALGWLGLLFSFAVIVTGAIAIGAKGRAPGIVLIVCSVAGAALGGTFVAVFMVLSLVGGILAIVGKPKTTIQEQPVSS